MSGNKPAAPLAVTYALFAMFGAIIAIPDPTIALPLVTAIAYLPIVGYALRDGSLRSLRWGIVALYAFGVVTSVGVSIGQERLRNADRYGDVLIAIAALSVIVLLGTYLAARRRTNGVESPHVQ